MSKIVAIITEYNPFHNGHKYQIDKIREEIPNATIIAIMSGNTVQRGEFAFTDKYTRAEMAIKCGIDAVFELPFPYSCATAEIFASAGVEIASKLGADYLYFGTESDNCENLEKIAIALDSQAFNNQIKELNHGEFLSYPALREKALSNVGLKLSNMSNDILAIEYIRAIKNKNLNLEYRAIKREGAGYKDRNICDIMSASAIREHYYTTNQLLSVPENAKAVLEAKLSEGKINDKNLTNRLLLSHIILNSAQTIEQKFDVPSGMGYYILECAKKCKNIEHFTDELSSKGFTTARLKRAVIYALFDVNFIDRTPSFTILLGANEKGKKVISSSRKMGNIAIITKYANSKKLSNSFKEAFEKSVKVDELYSTLYAKPQPIDELYKSKPYIN